ncbi:MAG: J domain-containing protein [Chloroflexi bacterium]|nr:J domain-containing protein [Chloroflexota bacterium]
MATAPAAATDPYRVLQVAPNADLEAIHAAYRRLARLYHPDLNPKPEAAARMRAINVAYAVLSDPARRAALDARRYLPGAQPVAGVTRSPVRPVGAVASPPTALQRRVDRIVAVLGVFLLIGIGYYAVNVIPYAERQLQSPTGQAPALASGGGASGEPTGGVADHPSGPVPARLRSDSGLHDFPGAVLVAPSTLEPFAALPILRIDAASRGIARYAVYYGDLTNGGAAISGLVGPASFDGGAPRFADCAVDASYCAGFVPGQSTGPPGLELFRTPDLVGRASSAAFVTHRVCCNGVFWSLSWYEQRTNMSYTIDLSRNVATRYGSQTADADVAAARAIGALATQLVRLP